MHNLFRVGASFVVRSGGWESLQLDRVKRSARVFRNEDEPLGLQGFAYRGLA